LAFEGYGNNGGHYSEEDDHRRWLIVHILAHVALGSFGHASRPGPSLNLSRLGAAPLLVALAPAFLFASFGAVQKALLERKSAFRTVSRVEVLGALVGALATIGAALSGAGAMSWTVGILVISTQTSIHFWVAAKWHPTRRVQLGEIRSLLHFSGNLSAFNVINYLARNADSIIVGRYLDASALGIYSIAYKIMLFPLQNLTFVANRRSTLSCHRGKTKRKQWLPCTSSRSR
jgi:PST family polysaccharide transporter